MLRVLARHWPEYLIEAALLGAFMVSACAFGVLLEHPASPVRQAISDPLVRRVLMGIAMGATALALVYSPWGKRSGAHFNPAVTLAFLSLRRVALADAGFYVLAQFLGGFLGVLVMVVLLGDVLADAAVAFVATRPGSAGVPAAFAAELGMSFVLMTVVLLVSRSKHHGRWTGACAAFLVTVYIILFAPVSGMSINPARSFASAVPAHDFSTYWIYVVAPLSGMLAAALLHARRREVPGECAKLHHQNSSRCIFCEWRVTRSAPAASKARTNPHGDQSMKRKNLYITAGVVAAFVLWLVFRPELLFINQSVAEAFQQSSATPLRTGMFHDGAHTTKGIATVYELQSGKRVLRLSDFETSNGPDLRVLLVAADDAKDSDAVKKAGFVILAKLKGNLGDQNYELPEGLDLGKYRAVTIWCNRFNVNFGTAPLSTHS